MNEKHLTLLELDAVRAGEASAEERAHAETCSECRAALDQLRSLETRLKAAARIPAVPDAVRHAIIVPASRRRPSGRRVWIPLATAAAALFGIVAFWMGRPADRNLDIVDAYALAMRVRSGGAIDAKWDVTGDGTVDRKDVDWIAREAVALAPRGNR